MTALTQVPPIKFSRPCVRIPQEPRRKKYTCSFTQKIVVFGDI